MGTCSHPRLHRWGVPAILNNFLNLLSNSPCIGLGNSPNSRRKKVVVTVIRRCKHNVEDTRKPVFVKSSCVESKIRSVSNKSEGIRLLMNERITWLCGPIGLVKHTAGRTFDAEKSSNGKGTKTILPLIMEGFSINKSINIFLLFL